MGRPDLTEVRTAEILDAFERCVARFGLEGSSLEAVAEEAGMKRSILRHYIGNRVDLIDALAERVVAKYRSYVQAFIDSVSEKRRIEQLLAFFFPDKPIETAESILVVEALIAAGDAYPRVRNLMSEYVEELVSITGQQLRLAYPNSTRQQCWNVAYGVVSICFNQDSLWPLELPAKYLNAAKTCSRRLIESLGNSQSN